MSTGRFHFRTLALKEPPIKVMFEIITLLHLPCKESTNRGHNSQQLPVIKEDILSFNYQKNLFLSTVYIQIYYDNFV